MAGDFRDRLHSAVRLSTDRVALAAGFGLLVAALSPALRLTAERSLTAHMVQHLALLQIGPLLIVSQWPAARGPARSGHGAAGRRAIVAWIAGVAAMVLWYMPPLFAWMMRTPAHHLVAEATLVGAGLLFWSPVFSRRSDRRLAAGPAIGYLFTACLASTIAGASIAFAAPGLYGGHPASALDQQVAGLMMWVPCCVVYVAAIMATLAHWYGGAGDGDDERRGEVAPAEA